MIGALVLGVLLAVGALAFVLYPVLFGVARASRRPPPPRETNARDAAIGALREIEFDRATGKLSDTDYAQLKAKYTRDAVTAMRTAGEGGGVRGTGADDEIEAAVRAFRAGQAGCAQCGPRPEPDAVFCSNCGRYLRDRCADCGAPVDAHDARFCVSCGTSLAA
jgi:hypothetical protein